MLIDFKTLFPKYNIKPKGVLHIGASSGQETGAYVSQGVADVVYIEALPDKFKDLIEHIKDFKGKFTCLNACVSDKDNQKVIFNVSNNEGQSSSLLEFGTHTKKHPTVKFTSKLEVTTSRVDSLFKTYNLIDTTYDFLNIDLQGAELIALRSMGGMLANFKWLYLEVNKEHLYKDCPLVADIDNYVGAYGFKRVETKWMNEGWGDALYIK